VRVNVDRWMLIVVATFIVVVGLIMQAQGIASGAVPWWKLPLSIAVFLVLQFTVNSACRRFALSEKALYFLSTIPLTMLLLIGSIQGMNHLPPGGLVSTFFICEAVILVLAAVGWQFRRRDLEPTE
jgi:hypothetical protein